MLVMGLFAGDQCFACAEALGYKKGGLSQATTDRLRLFFSKWNVQLGVHEKVTHDFGSSKLSHQKRFIFDKFFFIANVQF